MWAQKGGKEGRGAVRAGEKKRGGRGLLEYVNVGSGAREDGRGRGEERRKGGGKERAEEGREREKGSTGRRRKKGD
eukprot:scaffold43351_cov18-Tisochrysis_lutea.AAC.1